MATFQNERFNNQEVVVDGNSYVNCSFTNCTLVYRSGDLPQFRNCSFSRGNLRLEDAAGRTINLLSGLYEDERLAVVVEDALQKNDLLDESKLPSKQPTWDPEYTGSHWGRLGVASLVIVAAFALILLFYWYSYYQSPMNIIETTDADEVQAVREEYPLSAMPILPDELATSYDSLNDQQRNEISGYDWIDRANNRVSIPIEDAMRVVAEQGIPTFEADTPTDTEGE